MKKRFLSLVLAILVVLSLSPNKTAIAAATPKYTYDADAAVAYALSDDCFANKNADGDNMCAKFVSYCLQAGGLKDFYEKGAGRVVNRMINEGYAKGVYLLYEGNMDKLKAGDIIFVACRDDFTYGDYWVTHVVFCTENNISKEYIRFCAMSKKHHMTPDSVTDKSKSYSSMYSYEETNECGRCGGKDCLETYILSMYTVEDGNSFTVKFDANGGTNAPASQTKFKNVDLELTRDVPVRDGYRFLGWSESPKSALPTYIYGTPFSLNKDTTLYAVWANYTYNSADVADYLLSDECFVNLHSEREAYNEEFVRACLEKGGLTFSENSDICNVLNELIDGRYGVLYLADESKIYDRQLLKPGDIIATICETCREPGDWVGHQLVMCSEVNYKEEYYSYCSMDPWHHSTYYGEDEEGRGKGSYRVPLESILTYHETDEAAPLGDTHAGHEFKTYFFSMFSDERYVIKYDANGGKNAPDNQYKSNSSGIFISEIIPEKEGYEFIGWSTSSNASVVEYMPGDVYYPDASCTLYAIWEKIYVHIDGDINQDGVVNSEDLSILLANYGRTN